MTLLGIITLLGYAEHKLIASKASGHPEAGEAIILDTTKPFVVVTRIPKARLLASLSDMA